jgi:hypothetical protein
MLSEDNALTEFDYRVYNAIYRGGKARRLFRLRRDLPDGSIVAMRAWLVPKSSRTPEGFKYSLVYIDPQGRRALGYDNAEGKGHHRHEGNTETPVDFESIRAHVGLFLAELREKWGIEL